MKNSFVTDTMAIILRLEKRRLNPKVKSIFEEIEAGKSHVLIPAMVLAEIGYLSERNRIDTNLQEVASYCLTYPTVKIEPISEAIICRSFENK